MTLDRYTQPFGLGEVICEDTPAGRNERWIVTDAGQFHGEFIYRVVLDGTETWKVVLGNAWARWVHPFDLPGCHSMYGTINDLERKRWLALKGSTEENEPYSVGRERTRFDPGSDGV